MRLKYCIFILKKLFYFNSIEICIKKIKFLKWNIFIVMYFLKWNIFSYVYSFIR